MSRLPMADRRDQLVAAALTIAARDGIEAATVRAVAVEAGVSAGVVHYCFSDKNELLTRMAEAITQLNTPELLTGGSAEPDDEPDEEAGPDLVDASDVDDGDASDDEGGGTDDSSASDEADAEPLPLDQVLGRFLSEMWGALESTRGYQLLTYELTVTALRSPELSGVAQAQYDASRRAAVQILEHAAGLAQVRWTRPVDDLARIVVAAIDGASLAWLVDGDGAAAQRTLAATVQLLAGFGEA